MDKYGQHACGAAMWKAAGNRAPLEDFVRDAMASVASLCDPADGAEGSMRRRAIEVFEDPAKVAQLAERLEDLWRSEILPSVLFPETHLVMPGTHDEA
jgi:hypothetical protein